MTKWAHELLEVVSKPLHCKRDRNDDQYDPSELRSPSGCPPLETCLPFEKGMNLKLDGRNTWSSLKIAQVVTEGFAIDTFNKGRICEFDTHDYRLIKQT